MSKIAVIYWSQTGNTEEMAKAIAQGIIMDGGEANILEVSRASIEELKDAPVFAIGCPAMGDEVLEESEMEPFVAALEDSIHGKKIALFGSYDWGDGQWMRDWEKRIKDAGAVIVGNKGVISQGSPDEEIILECKNIGKQLAGF